jgi:dynactin complex subunit
MDNTLRANRILLVIEQPTLTEAEKLTLTTIDDLEEVFKSLAQILNSRVDSAGAIKKLNAYAFSQGIQLEEKKTFKSNVFLGASL